MADDPLELQLGDLRRQAKRLVAMRTLLTMLDEDRWPKTAVEIYDELRSELGDNVDFARRLGATNAAVRDAIGDALSCDADET